MLNIYIKDWIGILNSLHTLQPRGNAPSPPHPPPAAFSANSTELVTHPKSV